MNISIFLHNVSVSAGIAVTNPANQGQHKPSEDRGIWECFWKIAGHCARWGQQWWRYFFVIELYSPVEKLEVFLIHRWVKKGVNYSLMLHLFNFSIRMLYLLFYEHFHVLFQLYYKSFCKYMCILNSLKAMSRNWWKLLGRPYALSISKP